MKSGVQTKPQDIASKEDIGTPTTESEHQLFCRSGNTTLMKSMGDQSMLREGTAHERIQQHQRGIRISKGTKKIRWLAFTPARRGDPNRR